MKFFNSPRLFLFSTPKSFNNKFHKIFDYIWPIHYHELPKFLLMTALMFCILFIQNVVRALKDSIVNTMIGTETIAFLKFWGVLPAACLMTIIYVKLVNTIKNENIFYIILLGFLLFFAIFGFFIFPNHKLLHLKDKNVETLIKQFPNLKWFVLLTAKWGFSLFYIVAELWPNAVFALLYWQFVNMVTTVEESKRFYTLFGLLGQTGLYISGQFLFFLPSFSNYCINQYKLNCDKTELSVQFIISIILLLGASAIFIFWFLNHHILKTGSLNFKVKPSKISVLDGIKMTIESRYIRLITTLLICYGVAINLIEGPWKAKSSTLYQTADEYAAFVGHYLSYTGLFTLLFVLIGSNIIRSFGWFSAAIITPLIICFTGIIFFMILNFHIPPYFTGLIFITSDPTNIAVTIGMIQNVLGKASKYTLFDSTKEMSYVPLDDELKSKGKATADIIGVKLGKSTSALIQSLIFIFIPTATYQSITIYLMFIFIVVCTIWIWAVKELNIEYLKLVNKDN